IQFGQILRRWAISQTADAPAAPPDHAPKSRLCRRQNKLRIDPMNAEEDPEIIMSDLCADVEVEGHFLTIDIYKSDIDPSWILEVINEFGTSTVFDDPFLADGLAWQQFEKTVKEEGLAAFLTKKEKRQLFH
ncbi:hypothetical protein N9L47_13530, partial [Rhodobacteraceae bacterium]|nr:hypothetical protein [Paracoccaceae bacterium]